MDSSDEERPSFTKNKKFEIYGVFANDLKSDSEEETTKKPLKNKKFLNF